MHTELGRFQAEVQRCTLSWEGPRLRTSSVRAFLDDAFTRFYSAAVQYDMPCFFTDKTAVGLALVHL